MSQIGPRGEKICSGQDLGPTDEWTVGQTDGQTDYSRPYLTNIYVYSCAKGMQKVTIEH